MISIGTSQLPTTSSPYAPIGKTPVGLEPAENKRATLPPVEEAAALSKQRADETARKPAIGSEPEPDERGRSATASATELDVAEIAQVRELAATARKVQAHEAAHAAVGGALAGAKSFSYVTGPDGVRYAVAGEVSIEFGQSAGNPELTMRNASQVRAAALAPADPSSQDLQVAAQASQMVQQAQQDLAKLRAASNTTRNQITSALDAFGQVQREEPDSTSHLDQRA